jgi:hypothetical protein
MQRRALPILLLFALPTTPTTALAQSFDLRANWSNTQNPSGPWSYRDGSQHLLPGTTDWDVPPSTFWTAPQPGWATTRSGTTGATPFIFRSNGTETFPHDWIAGDIILRTRDPADGTGNGAHSTGPGGPGTGTGPAIITFTSPLDGLITIVGSVWPGRSSASWHDLTLTQNGLPIWGAWLPSGDAHTRAAPLSFQLTTQPVLRGDPLALTAAPLVSTAPGDFIGLSLNIIVCIGITTHPAPTLACPRSTAHLSINARTSYGTITYRWRKNSVPLLEGASNNRIHGVFSPTLTIDNPTAADTASYDCVVASVCSALPSDAATLTFCPAEFNCSGTLTTQDIFDYLNAWLAADPAADIDGIPGLATGDLFAYITEWFMGC